MSAHPRAAGVSEPRITWRYGNDAGSDMLRPQDARPEVRRHIRSWFAERVREQGGERLVEKTPSNALRPAFVDAIFPDALFLHILRDGRDAVLSIRDAWQRRATGVRGYRRRRWETRARELSPRRAPRYALELLRRTLPGAFGGRREWGPRLPGMRGLVRELDLLEVACLQWRMCVEISCRYGRRLPPERYLEVRLEELTPELLGKVLEFCRLEDHPAVRAHYEEHFDPTQASRRHHEADAADLERILDWIEPTQRWLGYPT